MKYFIFSIDTEPDCPSWTGFNYRQLEFNNFDGLERLPELLSKYGIPVTFYVTWSSATNKKAEKLLLQLKKNLNCEIASHLHPGDTPPYRNEHTDNILRLNNDELDTKFHSLHTKISEIYGKPESFRGAAWTIDNRTVKLLEKYGYTSDSSVTPGVCWKIKGRPDWTKSPDIPYILDSMNPGKSGISKLLEIPVSIKTTVPQIFRITGYAGSLLSMPLSSRDALVFQFMKRFPLRPRWIRPAFTKWKVMKRVVDHSAFKTGIVHGMGHSNELALGTSPFSMDHHSLDNIWKRLDLLFSYVRNNGFVPITVSGYNEIFRKSIQK